MLHKKNKFIKIILTGLIFLLMFSCTSYKEMTGQDQVVVGGSWKATENSKTATLYLMVDNQNDHAVKVSFSADYYLNGVLEESSEISDFCIKANKKRKGKLNGIVLTTSDITWAEVNSDEFEWEVNNMEVVKTASCEESGQ